MEEEIVPTRHNRKLPPAGAPGEDGRKARTQTPGRRGEIRAPSPGACALRSCSRFNPAPIAWVFKFETSFSRPKC